MNRSTLKLFIFCTGFIFLFAINSNAQTLTWNDLKEQQNVERSSMENRQKEDLNFLKELQKTEMEILKAESGTTANDILLLVDKQKASRADIVKIHSDERTKLAQIHADERKNFLAGQKQ